MPVLKKQNADPDEPKNYRPIFNLTFISKVLEWIVLDQVTQLLEDSVTLFALPDLSTAFDTVDHDLLLLHLETIFGIRGSVLVWLKSFLSDRLQAVCFN